MRDIYCKILLVLLLTATFNAAANDYFKDKPNFIADNLKQNSYKIDTSASAIVLYEKWDYDLTGTNAIVNCKVRRIIKIIKNTGTSCADIDIEIYRSQDFFSKIRNLSGTTYNLENGRVTEQPLDGDNIAASKSGHVKIKKISMPGVRAGSIIDYTYEVDQDITRDFCTWYIEEDIPKLYSELHVKSFTFLTTQVLGQSLPEFKALDKDDKVDALLPDAYMDNVIKGRTITDHRWVRKNIKGTDYEDFVANIDDYKEKMELSLSSFLGYSSWATINDDLIKSPRFLKHVAEDNDTIADKAIAIVGGEKDTLEKAKKIFCFVRDSVNREDGSGIWMSSHPARILGRKYGTVSDMNLLLVAMLQAAGIDCSPVILSTTNNGYLNDGLRDLRRFNYTVCQVPVGRQVYYLDASGKYNQFGVLPQKCYNGYARVINEKCQSVMLPPDMAKERSFFKVATVTNDADNYVVSINCFLGDFEAIDLRNKWNEDSANIKEYIHGVLKGMPFDLHLLSYDVQNLLAVTGQLALNIKAVGKWDAGAKRVYFSPYFYGYFPANPFKSIARKYPVEMPHKYDITYYLQLQLPTGYTLDDSLKPLNLRFGDDVLYQDAISYDKATNTMIVNSNMRISKTYFKKEDYPFLKEFGDRMLSQQQKNIVIKKLD